RLVLDSDDVDAAVLIEVADPLDHEPAGGEPRRGSDVGEGLVAVVPPVGRVAQGPVVAPAGDDQEIDLAVIVEVRRQEVRIVVRSRARNRERETPLGEAPLAITEIHDKARWR